MHRPTDCTPEKIKEICSFLKRGTSIEDACALSDVAEKTYYNWKNRGESGEEPFVTFLQESSKARAEARLFMIDIIQNATVDPKNFDAKPAQWFLSKSDRKNWGSDPIKLEQQVSVSTEDIKEALRRAESEEI